MELRGRSKLVAGVILGVGIPWAIYLGLRWEFYGFMGGLAITIGALNDRRGWPEGSPEERARLIPWRPLSWWFVPMALLECGVRWLLH